MNPARRRLVGLTIIIPVFLTAVLPNKQVVQSFQPGQKVSSRSLTFARREEAYRANNLGVASLEQYKAKDAASAFSRALDIDPNLLISRINLSIALYYIPDLDRALREAQKAVAISARAPQPHYIIALVARAQNRTEDAISEFEKVLQIDQSDVATNVNLGQLYAQLKRNGEASAAFRRAIAAEPYNETALYNLGMLLMRTGSKEEGRQLIKRFQQFRESGAGTTIGTNYLEQGRYAEAIASTGAEPELVNRSVPAAAFVDATEDFFGSTSNEAGTKGHSRFEPAVLNANERAEAIVLFDYDEDGDLDIFDASGEQRLLRNDDGRFTDVTAGSGLPISRGRYSSAAVAGDYDNDGKSDLFVARFAAKSFVLYHNDGAGHFSDKTKEAGIKLASPEGAPYLSAAFVDLDHDGDLDIFLTGPTNILFRNNSNGAFIDATASAKLNVRNSFSMASGIVPTDFDNRRDVDLFLVNHSYPPALFRNMRDGTFRDVAKEVGLETHGVFSCAAAGDVNKDGFTDFFLGVDRRGAFAMSDGRGHFRFIPAPAETRGAMAAQILDYDNDGLLDLLVVTIRGLRLWRNGGGQFIDVSERALPLAFRRLDATNGYRGLFSSRAALASGDFDSDGDVDLVLRGRSGELRVLRNEGGSRNHSIKVNPHGRVSNMSAVQTKIEVRAGSLWQKLETYSASPAPAPADVIFGLGKREAPDAVRVLWPAGIVQAETQFPAATAGRQSNFSPSFITLNVTELDRKPSSCPYLYTWNGERYVFVTDFMGGGEMGYLETPGRYNKPDPDEYVRIRDDQLKERNGKFELRVTNELEEALFLDKLQLQVIAHPKDAQVYPNEGMTDPPRSFKLYAARDARPPLTAFDEHGHDVLERISSLDRRYPDDFRLDRIRGYAEEHSLTLKLHHIGGSGPPADVDNKSATQNKRDRRDPRIPAKDARIVPKNDHVAANGTSGPRTILLLTGWTDYAWSSDNVAATQAGKKMKPPALQVRDNSGQWRTVIEDIGIPVGRPQTVTVDLTGKFLGSSRDVRIVTNMRIYWDQILVDTSDGESPTSITKLDPTIANLRWRGFSIEITPDGREPFSYEYERVSFNSPWKVMTGHYTREGDVRELLIKSDDMFVVSRPGDEISISFDATRLPPLPPGWKRTFLLYADGFSKEMDINSASPDQTMPLPFHGMTRYPYSWPEHYSMTEERRAYIEKYNTRIVRASVSRIDTTILGR